MAVRFVGALFGLHARSGVVPHATGPSVYEHGGYTCHVVGDAAELERHAGACEDLLARAFEDNFYFAPGTLSAELRHFDEGGRPYVVLAYRGDGRLVGIAPFTLSPPRSLRSPSPVLTTFIGRHSYLSHPILDRDEAGGALDAIWAWVERPRQPWSLVELHRMSPAGRTWPLIERSLDQRRRARWVRGAFSRATLERHESYEAFLAALPASRRKGLRQRRRRLEAHGAVTVTVHRSLDAAPDLAARFMALEVLSWKGAEGTALRQAPADTAFFEEIVADASAAGRLLFVELAVDGRPVAMAANFTLGRTMFAFKIAYDPAFADCSPGVLVEMETVRAFHDDPALEIADGGTAGPSYLDDYWRATREMREIHVSTGSLRSNLALGTRVRLTRAKRAAVAVLGDIRARFARTVPEDALVAGKVSDGKSREDA